MTAIDESTEATRTTGWQGLGTLPFACAVLVGPNGLYILLVAFGNITDFGTNQAFVQGVLGMQTTNFGAGEGQDLDPDTIWRAITDPVLQNTAYVALIIWESLTAIALIASVVLWIRARGTNYRLARTVSTIGLLMLIALFMGGFITIGGEWFQMWKSTQWNGLDPAFRNTVLALIALVLIHLPSPIWARADRGRIAAG